MGIIAYVVVMRFGVWDVTPELTAIVQAVATIGILPTALWLAYRFFMQHYWPAHREDAKLDREAQERIAANNQRIQEKMADSMTAGMNQVAGNLKEQSAVLTQLSEELKDQGDTLGHVTSTLVDIKNAIADIRSERPARRQQ